MRDLAGRVRSYGSTDRYRDREYGRGYEAESARPILGEKGKADNVSQVVEKKKKISGRSNEDKRMVAKRSPLDAASWPLVFRVDGVLREGDGMNLVWEVGEGTPAMGYGSSLPFSGGIGSGRRASDDLAGFLR